MRAERAQTLRLWRLSRQQYDVSAYGRLSRPCTSRDLGEGCLVHLPRTIGIAGVLAPVALPALVKGAIVLGVTRCLTLWPNDRFVRSTAVGALLTGGADPRASAGGWVGTWPCIPCEGSRPHRACWRSTTRPRPRRSAGARGSASEMMNRAGGPQGRHRRGGPCQFAFRWKIIARMAGDRARGGGEPRAGCRGTATGVRLVGVDPVSTSLPQTSGTDPHG